LKITDRVTLSSSVQLYGECAGPFVSTSHWLLAAAVTAKYPDGHSGILIWRENGSGKEKEFSASTETLCWFKNNKV
jgi:hypothetical protein